MLLCVVTVLASCGASTMKFEKVVGDGTYNDENPTLTQAAKLELKGELEKIEDYQGDLVLLKDTSTETFLSTYTVYNVATNATVWTGTESRSATGDNYTAVTYEVAIEEVYHTSIVLVMKTTVDYVDGHPKDPRYDYQCLTATGAEIFSLTDVDMENMADGWMVEDLLCMDGKVYRIADDGSVAYAFDWSELRHTPDEDLKKVGDFYFDIASTSTSILIYNATLDLVTTYARPSYIDGDDFEFYALANGNVLVQYIENLGEFAEDYDFMKDGKKYDLHSFLINAESGKIKELKLDFYIQDIGFRNTNNEDTWCFNEKIENIASGYFIEDQRLNTTYMVGKVVSLTNKGKIAGVIDDLIPNMKAGYMWQVATNRWVVFNLANECFLINEKGEVLGEITNAIRNGYNNSNAVVINNKIYDWDLNMKLDLTKEKVDSDDVEIMNHSVLFKNEDGEWKLYINGEVKTLINKATAEEGKRTLTKLSKALYMITDTATEGTTKYEIYNDAGTLLTTVESMPEIVFAADSNKAVLFTCEDAEGKTVYYRVG